MTKRIKLTTDVIVNKYLTFPYLTEFNVIGETEDNYLVKFLSETVEISKFECEILPEGWKNYWPNRTI